MRDLKKAFKLTIKSATFKFSVTYHYNVSAIDLAHRSLTLESESESCMNLHKLIMLLHMFDLGKVSFCNMIIK